MLPCHKCGTLISTYDAQAAARIAGDGNETLCPSCATAVYYAGQQDASEGNWKRRNKHDRA